MNQQHTPQPLYKVLNEKITQGNWSTLNNGRDIYSDTGDLIMECFGNYNITNEEDIVNAQYTALAVNNLANVADALAEMINISQQREKLHSPYEAASLKLAKEALKAIS